MNITKILASVPILKTFIAAKAPAEPSGASVPKNTSSAINDKVDISSAELSLQTISDPEAQIAAENVGSYFAENDEAIGSDTNKLAQL